MRSVACPERHNQWPLFYKAVEHAHLGFPTELGRFSTHTFTTAPSPRMQRQ